MEIIVGGDHNGFFLKRDILKYIKNRKIRALDIGPYEFDKNDDYPVFAQKVAGEVAKNPDEKRGILICGSGTGVAIAANKVKGIRSAEVNTEDSVYLARSHNDINVLCLNGLEYKGFYKKLRKKGGNTLLMDLKPKKVSLAKTKKLINIFLETKFEGGRHQRRLEMIKEIEDNQKIL